MKKKLDIVDIIGIIWVVIISPLLILIVIIDRIARIFQKKPPEKIYDIYVTYAPEDIRFAQEFIQASAQRGQRCFLSEFRESDVFAAAISGSKGKEKQLKRDILKSYEVSRSFVLISSGRLKSIPSGAFAKAITTVTTNSDRLNLFEMSLWRRNNDRINIVLCRERGAGLDFARHKFDPAYLTIGYDYSDGEIGEIIDNVLNDLNNPLPKGVERKDLDKPETSKTKLGLKDRLKDFIKGFLLLACPTIMILKRNHKVYASIGSKKILFNKKISFYKENNIHFDDLYKVQIGEVMKLRLIGDTFEIKSINNESQVVKDDSITEWSWNVKPLTKGKQQLILHVSIQLFIPKSGESYVDFPVYEKIIKVKVNRKEQIKDVFVENWKWLLGIILGSGLLWKVIDYFTK